MKKRKPFSVVQNAGLPTSHTRHNATRQKKYSCIIITRFARAERKYFFFFLFFSAKLSLLLPLGLSPSRLEVNCAFSPLSFFILPFSFSFACGKMRPRAHTHKKKKYLARKLKAAASSRFRLAGRIHLDCLLLLLRKRKNPGNEEM